MRIQLLPPALWQRTASLAHPLEAYFHYLECKVSLFVLSPWRDNNWKPVLCMQCIFPMRVDALYSEQVDL